MSALAGDESAESSLQKYKLFHYVQPFFDFFFRQEGQDFIF